MSWVDARVPHSGGEVAPGFESVGGAFAENFEEELELGASFAAVIDGELRVSLRGGSTDKKREQPWTEETLACVYSTGKAVLAAMIAHEVSEGRLDYDAPVAAYWPEFAEAGKERITVAEALSHQGGLCGFVEEFPPEDWLDWEATTARLAATAPLWAPGTATGYHPQTFGYIAGELIRRATGKSVGALLTDMRAQHGFEIYCGIGEDIAGRAAFMPKPPRAPDLGALNEYTQAAFLKPWSAPSRVSREDWLAAEIPASNMHADAPSLARFLSPLAHGGKWPDGATYLAQSAIDAALKERARGDDLVLPFHLSWAAGLMRNINRHFGPNGAAFGHAGFGGSCVIIDPENGLTAAYVMNKMSPHLVGDPRAVRIIDALYDCL